MSGPSLNNPAGRLFHLLHSIKRERGDTVLKQAWAKVLGADPDDLGGVLSKFADVLKLPHEIRVQMEEASPGRSDVFNDGLKTIESHLYIHSLGRRVEQYKGIDKDSFTALRHCDFVLSEDRPSDKSAKEATSEHSEQLRALQEDLRAKPSLSPEDTKLLQYADQLLAALSDYKLIGAEGVLSRTHEVATKLTLDVESGRLSKLGPLVQRFASIIKSIYLAFSMLIGNAAAVDHFYPGALAWIFPEASETSEVREIEDAEVLSELTPADEASALPPASTDSEGPDTTADSDSSQTP